MVLAEVEVEDAGGGGHRVALEDGLDGFEAALAAAAAQAGELLAVDRGDEVGEQVGVAEEEVRAAGQQSAALGALELGVFDEAEPGLPEGDLGGAVPVDEGLELADAGDGAGGGGVDLWALLGKDVATKGAELGLAG